MNRREFISVLGGAAAAWPVAARAQQSVMPVVGFLSPGSPSALGHLAVAFRRGLNEAGYLEHRSVGIEYAWAEGQNDRLRGLANELVRARVAVICAAGPPAALAAKAATSTIPIVFLSGEDPEKMGLVESFNRPGGNITGVAVVIETLGAKRLGLLREVIPAGTVIAVLLNPNEPTFAAQLQDVREAAQAVGQRIEILRASTEREIDAAFAAAAQLRAGAMLVGISFFYTIRREQLAALAAQASLPTIYGQREFTAAGGLMSYASDLADAYRQAGIYTGRVLKGEKPADLPVLQPTKFQLVINFKTAKALGVAIPDRLLALADEVIE
jgi:putative ABC transport system substrate-binding protein